MVVVGQKGEVRGDCWLVAGGGGGAGDAKTMALSLGPGKSRILRISSDDLGLGIQGSTPCGGWFCSFWGM